MTLAAVARGLPRPRASPCGCTPGPVGASTHTLCGCGDPALFLWFFQWPATALAHGQNPFYSTAMFHPTGINLLAQTSVHGAQAAVGPGDLVLGPVASLNVASTWPRPSPPSPCSWSLRRWVRWTPAAFVGGLLYGFSPFVLASLEFAHLMTAALMLLPLILAVLDEILVRQRHSARGAGVAARPAVFAQFFLSSELLAIVALVAVVSLVVLVVARPAWPTGRGAAPGAARRGRPGASGWAWAPCCWPGPVWFALDGPGAPVRPGLAQHRHHRRLHPLELRVARLPEPRTTSSAALGGYEGAAGLGGLSGLGAARRAGRRHGRLLARPAAVVLRLRPGLVRRLLLGERARASGCRPGSSPTSRWSTT